MHNTYFAKYSRLISGLKVDRLDIVGFGTGEDGRPPLFLSCWVNFIGGCEFFTQIQCIW